jgi:cytochrome c553
MPVCVSRSATEQEIRCACSAGENLQDQKHVPRIAGQSADYMALQLKNLRSGARADLDVTMGSAARALSDADIDALVVFASAKP